MKAYKIVKDRFVKTSIKPKLSKYSGKRRFTKTGRM